MRNTLEMYRVPDIFVVRILLSSSIGRNKRWSSALMRDANGVPRMLKKDVDQRSLESGGFRRTDLMMVGNDRNVSSKSS